MYCKLTVSVLNNDSMEVYRFGVPFCEHVLHRFTAVSIIQLEVLITYINITDMLFLLLFTLTPMGYTYATQQDVNVIWTGVLHVCS